MDARPAAAAETLFRSAVERYLLAGATPEGALPVTGYPAPPLASYVKSLAAQGS